MPDQEPHDQPRSAVVDMAGSARQALLTPMTYVDQLVFGADRPLHSIERLQDVHRPPTDRELFRYELLRQPAFKDMYSTIQEQRSLDEIVLECYYTLTTQDWMLWNSWARVVRGAYYHRYGTSFDNASRAQFEVAENESLLRDAEARWRLHEDFSLPRLLEAETYTAPVQLTSMPTSTTDEAVPIGDHAALSLCSAVSRDMIWTSRKSYTDPCCDDAAAPSEG